MVIGFFCSKEANSDELKTQVCLSKENNLCQKLQNLVPCFPVKVELVIERNISCKSKLSRWERSFWSKLAYSREMLKNMFLS
jgi:hypothetical protein